MRSKNGINTISSKHSPALNMTSGAGILFLLAALRIISSASSTRPLCKSHRGDSGITLYRKSRDRYHVFGFPVLFWRFSPLLLYTSCHCSCPSFFDYFEFCFCLTIFDHVCSLFVFLPLPFGFVCLLGLITWVWPLPPSTHRKPCVFCINKYHYTSPALCLCLHMSPTPS